MTNQIANLAARLAAVERRLASTARTAQLAYSSIEDGAINVFDQDGSLRAVIGQQPDGTTGINIVNGPPPPTPAPPTVNSVLGGVAAAWDGNFVDSVAAPLDFARIEVHAAGLDSFTPSAATLCGTLDSPRGGTLTIPADQPLYVRLLVRNTSGAASAPSAQAGPVGPAPVIAQEVLDGIISETKLARDAVTSAALALGAVNTSAIADDAITTPKLLAGAVTTDKLFASSVTAEKIAALAVTTDKLSALAVTADKVATNAITAAKIAAGAIDATHIKAGAITADKLDAGAINGKVVTGATIRTADSGRRIVLNPSSDSEPALEIYSGSSSETAPGRVRASVLDMGNWLQPEVVLESPAVASSRADVTLRSPELNGMGLVRLEPSDQLDGYAHITVKNGGPNGDSELTLYGSRGGNVGGGSHSMVLKGTGITWNSGTRQMTFSGGVLRAPNIVSGAVSITPTANTPTSVTVSGLSVAGTVFRAFVTANASVPGSVAECTATNVTANGLTVWINRSTTATTSVWYLIIGS
ncbi:hypothetical protein MUU72_29800 [Streptomyces sp. RS10V-4]|uniref:hypothetical protein n=1 Tax=Streptomyces rhizoryzae TaxID=2932493 RepID=UPI00200424DF|nr:hypothetical protein [Streptomyces rhizoryzae]MCK7627241.1 hypothetical protein [Streptomyces rhizoryzae]